MATWQIILIVVCGLIYYFYLSSEYRAHKFAKERGYKPHRSWWDICILIFAPIYVLWRIIALPCELLKEYYDKLKEHGGYRGYKKWKAKEKEELEAYRKEKEAERAEYERIKNAYLNGELTKEELPRAGNGIDTFEFEDKMGLYVDDYWANVREIVYVENKYNEVLNDFFIRHKDLRLYHMYKFIYLPNFNKVLEDDGMIHYLYPNMPLDKKADTKMDSTYPIKYLWYPEDKKKIEHGMMFFIKKDNHGAEYIKGHYYPLEEGNDEDIIAQLDVIVHKVNSDYSQAALHYLEHWKQPDIEEGSTDDYADEMHPWVVTDDEVAGIAQEIRERIEKLKEMGVCKRFIMSLLEEKPKLSRLVITKDLRIMLPDYNNMEIKMEPINKAVFFLFLRHPEGIIFKHLPDYRKELAEIYQMIKPLGLNERALRSIEDVTNPCLNSINEKCARIRGAFVSKMDEKIAGKYYILGFRGEAKKIELPRDLVTWEL